jgi:serine/threonine protein kinase
MAAVQPENKIVIGALLVGKYRVTRELGRGGMAAVYEAEHVDIGKRIALKILAAELSSSVIVIERFVREARAAASVKSPHIVEVYDSGRLEDGRPFIAMELLEGESLYDRMARVRLIDTTTTVRIIGQVAKGLTKAHAIGIVHRDLKPENIHICKTDDGEEIAKILDFGLAKFYSPVEVDEKTVRLTREGAVFGTPAYMSPEQVKGHGSVDHRADLWALGCMAFECLTGRPVWNTDQGVAMTFAAIATAPLPPPSRLRPDLPPAFELWFYRALERDPDKRFQTAKELADELAKALDAPPISLSGGGGSPSQLELDRVGAVQDVPASPRRRSDNPLFPALARRDGGDDGPLVLVASGFSARPPALLPPPAGGSGRPSEPLDLLSLRNSALSATDLPPTAASEQPPVARSTRRWGMGWWVVSALLIGAFGAGGWLAYPKVRARFIHTKPTESASSGVTPSSASGADHVPRSVPEPVTWMTAIEDGQQLLAAGDSEGAQRRFKDAFDLGGGALAKSFADQVKIGTAVPGPCRMAAFSHPRLGYGGNVGRPAVAATSKGAVVAWTDDHEQPGHEHVYSVLVDTAGRPTSPARDLTPEADYATRPELLSAGERVVLLFWDRAGRQPGIKARWLDADGRIGGMSVEVGTSKLGLNWPALDRSPDGAGFWVTWQANTDREGDDLFLRRLDADLQPQGPEVRAADYEPYKGKAVKLGVPSVGVSSSNVFLAYTLQRDRQFWVERMRIPLTLPELLTGGLQDKAVAKGQHELGETLAVNEDKASGDYSSIACGRDACYLVWHEIEKGGAQAALVDPTRGTLLWRKRFALHGGHPAVAVASDGQAEVVFYDAGRVRLASISRDGVGVASTFARTTGDQPRGWIAAGRQRGEWLVSWLDVESGHTEPFLARLECQN